MATNPMRSALREVERRMTSVAKERDKLEDAIETLQGLRDSCRDAYDSLTYARDALSELV